MTTSHKHIATSSLAKLAADPEAAAVVVRWAAGFATGAADIAVLAVYGQTPPPAGEWSIGQLSVALRLEAGLRSGELMYVKVPVGTCPEPDRAREANAAALASVSEPFKVVVDREQNGAPADGEVAWGDTIEMYQSTGIALIECAHTASRLMWKRDVPPGHVPSEIGYTLPSCTMRHINRDGGVARWPYGDTMLTVLTRSDPL